jgi:anti-sigma regulatory factor (Ser/Thr protein kinase)
MAVESSQRLLIGNRLSELAAVERRLAELTERWALSPRTAFALDLVVNEAVTNVITHAYDDDRPREIGIEITDNVDGVVVEVVDDGRPFDPLDRPPMVVSGDLEQAAIGGRGVHLIKTYSDAQDYRFISGRNHLRLVIRKQN